MKATDDLMMPLRARTLALGPVPGALPPGFHMAPLRGFGNCPLCLCGEPSGGGSGLGFGGSMGPVGSGCAGNGDCGFPGLGISGKSGGVPGGLGSPGVGIESGTGSSGCFSTSRNEKGRVVPGPNSRDDPFHA